MRRRKSERAILSGKSVEAGMWRVTYGAVKSVLGKADDLAFWSERAREDPRIIPFLSPALLSNYEYYRSICLAALGATDSRSLFPAILQSAPKPSPIFILPGNIKTREIYLAMMEHFGSVDVLRTIPSSLMGDGRRQGKGRAREFRAERQHILELQSRLREEGFGKS